MATSYSQLSYGSSGSEVEKLQDYLNQVGNYGLVIDGKYGPATEEAVKDYQSRNNLAEDGIAGNDTWASLSDAVSKLTSSSGNADSSTDNASQNTTQAAPDYSKYSYDASTDTAYQQALAALQQASAAVPTYKASYDEQLQAIYDQIVNREKFSYDLNSDALYQQYADQYQLMGLQASMDTMGQAAALTGGYGNSFASTAGNQAYQAYLQQLNQVVPELYGMALDQYNAEGDRLLTQYSMIGDMADDEYGKYLDALNQYWQNVSFLKQNADDAYDRGYTDWLNSYQMGVDAENTAYIKQQDEYEKLVSLITSTGYAPTAEELEAAGMSEDQAAAYADYFNKQNATVTTGGYDSTGGNGDTGGGGRWDNGDYSEDAVKKAQEAVGATQDGKWGADSAAKAKAMGYNSLAEVIQAKVWQGPPLPAQTNQQPAEQDVTGTVGVSDNIKSKVSGFTNNTELANYLDGLSASGIITDQQADALYAEYKQPDQAKLKDRTWKLKSNGGINWFGGIDNNATVVDQYGNVYQLDTLVTALVAEGMSKANAKAYVKNLQARLGG